MNIKIAAFALSEMFINIINKIYRRITRINKLNHHKILTDMPFEEEFWINNVFKHWAVA